MDAVQEQPQVQPLTGIERSRANLRPPWTPETAKEASRLGAIALKSLPRPVKVKPPGPTPDPYLAKRLVRVRKQIDQLSDALEAESDPQKLDRLASALGRLSEIERQLAFRPMPGSLKPSSRQRKQSQDVEPMN